LTAEARRSWRFERVFWPCSSRQETVKERQSKLRVEESASLLDDRGKRRKRSEKTHLLDAVLVTLSDLISLISGLPRPPDKLLRVTLNRRNFLLKEVQSRVGVVVRDDDGLLESEALGEGLELLEDGGGQGGDAVVEAGGEGVGGELGVEEGDEVFDHGIVVGLSSSSSWLLRGR
jgi:hypothetical protein